MRVITGFASSPDADPAPVAEVDGLKFELFDDSKSGLSFVRIEEHAQAQGVGELYLFAEVPERQRFPVLLSYPGRNLDRIADDVRLTSEVHGLATTRGEARSTVTIAFGNGGITRDARLESIVDGTVLPGVERRK